SRPNSHDLEYTEGTLKYIDTYIGGEKFAGEEAIWQDDTPFWSMNYIGRILDERFLGSFLK
ncbi:MAG TPA: transcriptional regulator, partial [Clostridium sp.]|nr:transcriptional regulator [Clostridium sp.]